MCVCFFTPLKRTKRQRKIINTRAVAAKPLHKRGKHTGLVRPTPRRSLGSCCGPNATGHSRTCIARRRRGNATARLTLPLSPPPPAGESAVTEFLKEIASVLVHWVRPRIRCVRDFNRYRAFDKLTEMYARIIFRWTTRSRSSRGPGEL